MAADTPQVVVVVVAWESGDDLQRCIDALDRQTFRDFETVVWDNASTDRAPERLTPIPGLRVVHSDANIGFAAANNRAAALSRAPYIVTLNPDAFAEPDWLQHLVDAADAWSAESVASLQLADHNPGLMDGAGDCMSIAGIAWRGGFGQPAAGAPQVPGEIFAACAAAALYRRDMFEALGGFEERFFCYYEDVDLGFRIRLAGGRCVLEPRAVVRHKGSAASGKISGFAERHGTRNRLWAFLRDMPLVLAPVAWPAHLLITLYILARTGGALRGIRMNSLGEALRGAGPYLCAAKFWPRGGLLPLVRALSWSPFALSRRAPIARPLAPRARRA